MAAGAIGTKKLASNVKIYEKVGTSTLTEISVDDITVSTVPASKIAFVSYDYAGRVNYLVLSDVTGDGYNYGFFAYEAGTPGSGMDVGTNDTLAIRNADSGGKETTTTPIEGSFSVPGGRPGGMAVTGSGKVASYLTLKSAVGLKRTAFDLAKNTVITANDQYPVWEKVQCYNSTTGSWYPYGYTGLAQALAFSDNITVYFDRAPQEGGKIRMVVVY
ncbi:hypothetical protein SDC9_102495 [bioreactor metagenome]|uniref:Uncharacterized protein n=1 Tax=bioreactor metagenome TaxID=1076179 RepID=A0A645ASH4_9ZZZZ